MPTAFCIHVSISIACRSGCSLCNGSRNSDCLACEDTTLYRDTTNRLGAPCVTSCGSRTVPKEDVFGIRTCALSESVHILIQYSIYLLYILQNQQQVVEYSEYPVVTGQSY